MSTILKYCLKVRVYWKNPRIRFWIIVLFKTRGKHGWWIILRNTLYLRIWLIVHIIIHRSGFLHYRRYQKIIIGDGNNRPKYIHRTVGGRLCGDDDIIVGRRRLRALPASPQKRRSVRNMCRKHVIILATAHNDSVCRAYIVYSLVYLSSLNNHQMIFQHVDTMHLYNKQYHNNI